MGAGFSKLRASHLHRNGLRLIRDALSQGQLLSFDDAKTRHGLNANERGAWEAATRALQASWGTILASGTTSPDPGEWVGCFATQVAPLSCAVTQVIPGQNLVMGGRVQA